MAGRKGFMIYTDWWKALSVLTGEELRQMLQAMVDFTESEREPEFADRLLRSQWEMIRTRMVHDAERYEQTKRARQGAANKRWEKQREEQARDTTQPAAEQRSYGTPFRGRPSNSAYKTREEMDDGMDQYLNW